MMLLYNEIQCTWWQVKGRTSTAIAPPNMLEYLGSLDEGEFICRILVVRGALLYFVPKFARQKVSCLPLLHGMQLEILEVCSIACWNVHTFTHTVSSKVYIVHSHLL